MPKIRLKRSKKRRSSSGSHQTDSSEEDPDDDSCPDSSLKQTPPCPPPCCICIVTPNCPPMCPPPSMAPSTMGPHQQMFGPQLPTMMGPHPQMMGCPALPMMSSQPPMMPQSQFPQMMPPMGCPYQSSYNFPSNPPPNPYMPQPQSYYPTATSCPPGCVPRNNSGPEMNRWSEFTRFSSSDYNDTMTDMEPGITMQRPSGPATQMPPAPALQTPPRLPPKSRSPSPGSARTSVGSATNPRFPQQADANITVNVDRGRTIGVEVEQQVPHILTLNSGTDPAQSRIPFEPASSPQHRMMTHEHGHGHGHHHRRRPTTKVSKRCCTSPQACSYYCPYCCCPSSNNCCYCCLEDHKRS